MVFGQVNIHLQGQETGKTQVTGIVILEPIYNLRTPYILITNYVSSLGLIHLSFDATLYVNYLDSSGEIWSLGDIIINDASILSGYIASLTVYGVLLNGAIIDFIHANGDIDNFGYVGTMEVYNNSTATGVGFDEIYNYDVLTIYDIDASRIINYNQLITNSTQLETILSNYGLADFTSLDSLFLSPMSVNEGDIVSNDILKIAGANNLNQTGGIYGNMDWHGALGNSGRLYVGGQGQIGFHSFADDLNLNASSHMYFDLNRQNLMTPGVHYDTISVLHTLNLAGNLHFTLISSNEPEVNDTFKLISAEHISGSIDTFYLPYLSGGKRWNLMQTDTSLVLHVGEDIGSQWLGLKNSDWTLPDNWLNQMVPDSSSHVVIDGFTYFNAPQVDSQQIRIKSLDLKNGATVGIKANASLELIRPKYFIF